MIDYGLKSMVGRPMQTVQQLGCVLSWLKFQQSD